MNEGIDVQNLRLLQKTTVVPMSVASRLVIVLAGLVVISAFWFSTRSPGTRNASSSRLETSQSLDHQDGPNAVFVLSTQTTPVLPRRVKKFPSNLRSADIDFLSFEFKRPYLGYEGP